MNLEGSTEIQIYRQDAREKWEISIGNERKKLLPERNESAEISDRLRERERESVPAKNNRTASKRR